MAATNDKNLAVSLDNLKTYNDYIQKQYNKTIIGLFIEGRKITYMTGDGEIDTFIDTDNSIYSLGTDSETGLTKIYKTTGSNEDGTMTQKAITDALSGKAEIQLSDDGHGLVITNLKNKR